MIDEGCRYAIGTRGEVCHLQPTNHEAATIRAWRLPPHEYVSPAAADVRPCICRSCADGACGVETTRRDGLGRPVCTACSLGEHRVRY